VRGDPRAVTGFAIELKVPPVAAGRGSADTEHDLAARGVGPWKVATDQVPPARLHCVHLHRY
jgi:hypothetical protein